MARDDDQATLLSTVGRGLSLAKAARGARQLSKLDASDASEEDRARARLALAELLGSMKGLPMKVGQLLANDDSDDPMQSLVDGVEPMPLEEAKALLRRRMSADQLGQLNDLQPALHAASLGQVHRAWLSSDRRALAVKIQYKDIGRAVRSEMNLIGLMPKVGPMSSYAFDLDAYKQVLSENIERELDYESEARRQTSFRLHVQVEGLIVPEVLSELSSSKVLVQQYAPGLRLAEAKKLAKPARLRIARTLLMTLFHGLFKGGLVHGDPHSGNYGFTPAGEVILYDFGCIVEVPEAKRKALLLLIAQLREGHTSDLMPLFLALGFDEEKLGSLAAKLQPLARLFFAPFLMDGPFRQEDWKLKQGMSDLLGDLRWWFRSAGPADLFLLLRAVQGVLTQLRELDVRLPWWALVENLMGPDALKSAARREAYSPELGAAASPAPVEVEHLKVRLEREKSPLLLTFPAQAAFRLSELVPPDLLSSTQMSAIEKVEEGLKHRGLSPGVIVELETEHGALRIWLV